MAASYEKLNKRLTAVDKLVRRLGSERRKPRKARGYTDEERAAIRAMLQAGQEEARKKHEAEAKTVKRLKANKREEATPIN